MSKFNTSVVVLDACVLYSAPLRDILMHLAIQKTYRPKWTATIQEEWVKNLLKNRVDLTPEKLNRTVELMDLAFPDANVLSFEHLIGTLNLPDENDRHVFAAAIECKADKIVTFNLKDFPKSDLEKYHIEAIHPDKFICNLFENDEFRVKEALRSQVSVLKNPQKSQNEVLMMLKKCGLEDFVALF